MNVVHCPLCGSRLPLRIRVLSVLKDDSPISISNLHGKWFDDYDYKSVHKQVMLLKKMKFVKLKKQKNIRGQPVMVIHKTTKEDK